MQSTLINEIIKNKEAHLKKHITDENPEIKTKGQKLSNKAII